MIDKEVDVGIFKIKLTIYKTGNIHMCFVNRVTGEEITEITKNPFLPQTQRKNNSDAKYIT